ISKEEYIYMIIDNVLVFGINSDLQGDTLRAHLEKFDDKVIKAVAGFNQKFLEHFLIISKGKDPKDIDEEIQKMEKISLMISPMGNLHYLRDDNLEFILTKLGALKLEEITETKIIKIVDEQLEKQFGGAGHYTEAAALEGQLQSAAFYLSGLGYPRTVIEQKLDEVRKDPSKLDALFNVPEMGAFDHPPEFSSSNSQSIEQSQDVDNAIEGYIASLKPDISDERAKKAEEIIIEIREIAGEQMNENYEKVFKLMHPDRLARAAKMLRGVKKKSKRIKLYLEWFFCTHLISSVEFKVEHWQVSSHAGHGQAGVYSAGIDFSRYDVIVRDFNDGKLTKVINITRRILQTPSKKAVQKLAQDLVAETGFDEHLYFTD
ncbi:MAG: hypothetical protein ACFFAT_16725, partial [Promethearchaeota archaeon]